MIIYTYTWHARMYVYVCTKYLNPNVGACRHAKHTKQNFNKFQHSMLKFVEIC